MITKVSVRLVDEAAEAEVRRLKKEAKKERKRAREEKSDREKVRCAEAKRNNLVPGWSDVSQQGYYLVV